MVRFCAFGGLGSGKTLSVVKEALRYHRDFSNLPIFSNIELFNVPDRLFKRVDSASVLFEIDKPCFLLLDELWSMADSRKSMSLINDVMSMLLLRSRKKNWRVGYTQQWYTQTDIRIRFITDVWILPDLLRGNILREEIYDKHANFLCSRCYDATLFFEDFDTWADPFTLDLEELRFLWDKYRKDRGLKSERRIDKQRY